MVVVRYILIFLFLHVSAFSFSQSIDEVKKKKEQAEKEISYLNKLLNSTRNNRSTTLQKLTIINQKIVKGKEIIQSLNDEVSYLEKLITDNERIKTHLESNRQKMMDFYAKMVYETWKKKNQSDKLVFIFSSTTLMQAYARYKYFDQVQDYSKRQIELIKAANDSLTTVNNKLNLLVSEKNGKQNLIVAKNAELIREQNQANSYVNELKKKERELDKKLKAEIKKREVLANKLKSLIAAQAKKSGSKNSNYKLTPEEKLISDDFAKNKGKLPWPVEEGFVSEKFGVNVHPLFKQVKLTNDGITVTTSAGADVRSVFTGTVVEIMFIPGYNNVVMIRHGNYLTLYSNIIKVYIRKGDVIKLKQKIGKLASDNESSSTLNFQIWRDKEKLDPQLWLSPW
ncbi:MULTISPECIES: murein hydrolase activator EnvC family protein [Porphyromonadaceae]|uniref:Peptidase M23 n=1 Tax=Sanguibacteroides justesenii TaxID=1547597 RepID=A0A0C3RDU3_9PORP|nr:peptidoglycan DD-metalloendopeptidase family protein [Sanguibacteroides sp. AM78-02pH3A]KIO44511.1 peptidase M23 [Sanguibacteroides justesenii]KIO45232.1 peptidase M23 [Sanguibacteroides justesenii]